MEPISTCRCIRGYSNWRYSEGSINLYHHVMLPVQQMSPSTARHHWMHLKDSGGIYVQTADQSFSKVAWETEAICWQWHHWHLSYHSLLTQWHYFQSEMSELPHSFFSAVCQLSGEPAPPTNSLFFFYPFIRKNAKNYFVLSPQY